jgi:hypothetical protein
MPQITIDLDDAELKAIRKLIHTGVRNRQPALSIAELETVDALEARLSAAAFEATFGSDNPTLKLSTT